ncbi:MAG: hypothetical protein Q8O10_02250 [candidate division Zixibacteria bacterium]|nr:hypothetical protein [candidate division Zixibacteria bacterium]
MPQISVTPAWIQTFSALLTPLIALITISILVLQYLLARQRWRLDLYDKRYPVFFATKQYIGNILINAKVTDEESFKFLIDTRDKEFLFGKDVQELIDELYKRGLKLKLVQTRIDDERLNDEKRERIVDENFQLLQYFIEQSGVATEVFKKYLAIEQNWFVKQFERATLLFKQYLYLRQKTA